MSKLGSFVNLVRNEWMKLMQRKSTWIMSIILIIAVFGIFGVLKWDYSHREESVGANTSEQRLQQQINTYEAQKSEAEPSSLEYKNAVEQIELAQYRLDEGLAPAEVGSFWHVMNTSSNFFSLIVLFVIIVASGILAHEFQKGTIKLLAIRPATRTKLLYSKYVTVLLFSVAIALLLLVSSLVASLIYFPYDSYTHLTWNGEAVSEWPAIFWILQSYLYAMVNVVVMGTIAFVIGALFRSSGLAIGITMFLSFATLPAMMMLRKYEWAKYILFAHNEFSMHLSQPFVDVTPIYSLIVILVYLVIFHVLMYTSFKKRDIAV